jgi:hypothetical protein
MMHKIAAGVLLLAGGVTVLCLGVSYGAYAIYTALLPLVGDAPASGIIAVVFLIVPVVTYVILAARAKERAKQVSMMSVVSAGLGLLTTFLTRRR